MLQNKENFDDLPSPSVTRSRPSIRTFYMNTVTRLLESIISKRQKKFVEFAEHYRVLTEKTVPAVYIPYEEVEKMASKCHRFSLSEGDFESLDHWVNKFARMKVEHNGLLDQELYFKYTRLFYYSYLIRLKSLLSKIASIFS